MTMLDPSDFDPDDERLSRFIDDDLGLAARDELERELAEQPALRSRLAALQAATQWTAGEPVELPTERAEGMLMAALHAFEAREVAVDTPPSTAHDGDRDARSSSAVGNTVIPMAPRRPRVRRWSPALVGWSAAALLVIATVAGLATAGSSSDDSAGDAAAMASSSTLDFEVERQVNEALDSANLADEAAESPMAEQDTTKSGVAAVADGAGTQLAYVSDLGSFSDVESLVSAIVRARDLASALPAAVPTSLAAAPTTTFAASSATAAGSTSCRPDVSGSAAIGGRAVRWTEVGTGRADDPRRIVIIDAVTCELVLERTI